MARTSDPGNALISRSRAPEWPRLQSLVKRRKSAPYLCVEQTNVVETSPVVLRSAVSAAIAGGGTVGSRLSRRFAMQGRSSAHTGPPPVSI